MATAAAAPVETPAAAPATPAAAPSTPAPSSAPATPSTLAVAPASFETPTMNPGEGEMQYLERVRVARDKFDAEQAAPTQPAAPAVAAPTTDKPLDGEAGAEAVKPEAPAIETTDEDDPLQTLADDTLAEKGPLPPRELAQKLRSNPALDAELKKDPELYHSVMAASRLAAQVSAFKEVFADPNEAKFALENATSFSTLRDAVEEAAYNPAAVGKFVQNLIEMSYERDEQGNVKMVDGKPVAGDTAGRLIDNLNRSSLDFFIDQATKGNDEELLAACNVLKARMEGAAPQDEELSEQMKQQKAALDARETELARAEQQRLEQQHSGFEQFIGSEVEKQVADLVTGLVNRTNITDFNKKAAVGEITNRLYEAIKNDKMFVHQRDSLMRRGYSDGVKRERIALAVNKAKAVITRIAGPVLRDAGASFVAQRKAVADKVAAQVTSSRTEPKGASTPPAPMAAQTPEQKRAAINTDFQAEHGRQPNEQEFLREWAKRSA